MVELQQRDRPYGCYVKQSDIYKTGPEHCQLSGRAKEATIFPDDPLPDDIPGIPEPVEGWDPGPVTTSQQFSTGRWLQVELEKSIEMASYVEMEVQGGETMNYAGWGNAFAVGVEDALYIGKRVRFWVYAGNGSVAKTIFSELDYRKEFPIDEN